MAMNFYYKELFTKRMTELADLRYRDLVEITPFAMQEATNDPQASTFPQPPTIDQFDKQMKLGAIWQGRDRYIWLSKNVTIPVALTGQDSIGIFDFGVTGGGHNSGFESLLFIDGQSYQGVDSNHQEVLFTKEFLGKNVRLDFYLWSGLEGGGVPREMTHEIKKASIGYLDLATDSLYFWTRSILGSINALDDSQPEKHVMLNWLKTTFQKINYTNVGSDQFYQSVADAEQWLAQTIKENPRKLPVHIHAIGHTHIDVAWLWQLKHTREKSIRSFSTVDRLMQRYDDYLFFHSTPQVYDYVKQDHPELYCKIKQYVKEGRWEVGGGMWVEADTNVTSGESLARQFLYGTRFFEAEFGQSSDYLWLPDVFGYSWCLPQLLNLCDINTFYTTKISWNEHNRMPNDSFKWSGVDGSEVLVHFITVPDPNSKMWFYTYNGQVEPEVVMGTWTNYADKAINQDLLLAYGYGDGGGGVNRHMIEMRRKINEIPAMPTLDTMSVTDYNKKLHQNIDNKAHNGYVHRWDNELYLEYHRGTYTTQAKMKQQNRKLEFALKDSEFTASLKASVLGAWQDYPVALFETSWKTLLRNQFHDIIPGSSIHEVYQDAHEEYQGIWKNLTQAGVYFHNELNEKIEHSETTCSETICLQNSSNFVRTDLFFLAGRDKDYSYQGQPLLKQKGDNGCYYYIEQVPQSTIISLTESVFSSPSSHALGADPFVYSSNKIETPFYRIQWNAQGQLTELFDKEHHKQVLATGGLGNLLELLTDKPRQYDAWELEITMNDSVEIITQLISVKQIVSGILFSDVEFIWHYNKSKISQKMRLYSQNRRIDFITHVDWQERDKLLKAGFIVDIRAPLATYDIQFGNCQRPTHHSNSWDHAKFEVPAHQWADLSEYDYGVALMNDCKYGYDIYQNKMRISLLKSAQYPDPTADLGEQHFTYSLLPHQGSWQEANVIANAWSLNSPLLNVHNIDDALLNKRFIFCEQDNILIDAIKKSEEGDYLIVRMHESFGKATKAILRSDFVVKSWQLCNVLEKPKGAMQQETELSLSFRPYEIKSFIVAI